MAFKNTVLLCKGQLLVMKGINLKKEKPVINVRVFNKVFTNGVIKFIPVPHAE